MILRSNNHVKKKKRMKRIFSPLALLLALPLFVACNSEDSLTPHIDFTSPYIIQDNPGDPIQHEVYAVYEKFGVPVYFNDTIVTRVTGKDLRGNDVLTTETIDLNWNFQSYDNSSVKYSFKYIHSDEDKYSALQFAKEYLSMASEKMRPFCILLVDTLYINRGGAMQKPEYYNNFRTLVTAQTLGLDEEARHTRATNILRDQVLSRVALNTELVERFGAVSSRDKFYGRPWVNDGVNGGLGCVWQVEHAGTFWKPQDLWEEGAADEYISYDYYTNVSTIEEFEEERASIFSQIGKYGFICGDTDYNNQMAHLKSPANVSQDLNYYVTTMLAIGQSTFMARYGAATLVKKKYDILANYITEELGIDLDF